MKLLDIPRDAQPHTWMYELNDPHTANPHRHGNTILSDAQADEVSETGAFVWRGLLSSEEVENCAAGIREIEDAEMSSGSFGKRVSKSYPGNYLRDIHKSTTKVHGIIRNPLLLGTLRHLLGPKISLRAFSARTTYIDGKTQTRWHRDQRSSTNPKPPVWSNANDISVLIYLTPANEETGAFEYIPNSHTNGINLDEAQVYLDHKDSIKVTCKPGDAIVSHSSLYHRSTAPSQIKLEINRSLLILHFGPNYYCRQEYENIKTAHLDKALIQQAEDTNDYETLELLTYSGTM